MAKRFTDSRKWYDPWFRKLPIEYKLFWCYITDICDHSGFWKVDIELASFYIGKEVVEESILKLFNNGKERILVLRPDLWFLPTFIPFQYGQLNPNNNLHISVINTLKKSGIGEGLVRGYLAPMDKDMVKDKVKDKGVVKGGDFLETLKTNIAYTHINLEVELAKMDAWFAVHKGRQKTKRFVLNWLNKIELPLKPQPKPQIKHISETAPDPKEREKVLALIRATKDKIGKEQVKA